MFHSRTVPLYCLLLSMLIGGLVHVAFFGVPFTYSISQLYYGACVILWAVSVSIRIYDRRVRSRMLMIAGLLILYFSLQVCAYVLLSAFQSAGTLLWYAYYIPELCIPLIVLDIALFIYADAPMSTKAGYRAATVVGILLMAGVMTNDFHQLAFSSGMNTVNKEAYQRGVLYYLMIVYIVVILGASLFYLLKAIRKTKTKTLFRVPLLLLGIGLLCCACTENLFSHVKGVRVWNIGETYAFFIIFFFEICIFTGFLSSNYGYRQILEKLPIPAEIHDLAGKLMFRSSRQIVGDENNRQFSMEIDGGEVKWEIDVAAIHALNAELEDITDRLDSRNELLQSENTLKEEKEMLSSRNRLYSGIAVTVSSQLTHIEELLNQKDADFRANLAGICVLNAYIKRRSNLELLKDSRSSLPLKELYLAIAESLEYMELCGINTMVNCFSETCVPTCMVISAYEFFEQVVETCLDSLSSMAVFLSMDGDRLVLRLFINAQEFSLDTGMADAHSGYRKNICITKEEQDTLIVFSMEEGRDSK